MRGTEDMLLWRHRVENKCSTEGNMGRFFPGWSRPTNRWVKRGGNKTERRRAAGLPEGPQPPSLDVTEAALQGDGPVLSAPGGSAQRCPAQGSCQAHRPSTASLTAHRASRCPSMSARTRGYRRARPRIWRRWPVRDPWIAYRAFPGAPKLVLHELESDVLGWHIWRTREAPSCQYRAEHDRPDAG
jgi:hypothetical protein